MKYFAYILIILVFTSCSESKILLRGLNKHQASLAYLHDSRKRECDRSSTLSIKNLDAQLLDSTTSVNKISQKVLPFIFYNYAEVNLGIKLGKNSIKEPYPKFLRESFRTESERSGCYSLANSDSEADYQLEIKGKGCEVNSKYKKTIAAMTVFFYYIITSEHVGYPSYAKLDLSIKLSKGGHTIFEQNYLTKRIQPFINSKKKNSHKTHMDIVANMAESLSLSTKQCIETIISDLNKALEKEGRSQK